MADEEQFSLCWNNFNTNLSAGFHESLCRGDLVDVTLAAEGQLVKAHRLVLSVCSPYFRKMFTQMPANQHAFVFLKDVSSSALKDLIQFMYCGEVNVKQEALPAFISTAEALQIKGLTESSDGTVPAQGSASPTKDSTTASTPIPDQSTLRPRSTRIIATRPQAFKIESEGSSDEKQTVTLVQTTQPSKRSSRQSITVAPKRIKMSQSQESSDPLDDPEHEIVTPQHLKVTEATEFIDLPIEGTQLNPKTEPEYVEDTQVIETEQDEDEYVEDVTYGEEKYDESYFTEGDDKAGVSGFSETYATEGDQSNTDAQDGFHRAQYYLTPMRTYAIVCNGHAFVKEKRRLDGIAWHCMYKKSYGCKVRGRTYTGAPFSIRLNDKKHTHKLVKVPRLGPRKLVSNSEILKCKDFMSDAYVRRKR